MFWLRFMAARCSLAADQLMELAVFVLAQHSPIMTVSNKGLLTFCLDASSAHSANCLMPNMLQLCTTSHSLVFCFFWGEIFLATCEGAKLAGNVRRDFLGKIREIFCGALTTFMKNFVGIFKIYSKVFALPNLFNLFKINWIFLE